MAMTDAARQSNGLPSLSCLDLEKIKKESSAYNHNIPITSALNMPAPPLASPSIYSGPPPPYSYPSSTASSVVGGTNGYISPPESRRHTEEEKEPILPKLQSLPSIHEALGNDQHISINSLLSKTSAFSQAPPAESQRSPTSPISHSKPELTPSRVQPTFAQGYPSAYRAPERSEKVLRSPLSPRLHIDVAPHQYPPSATPRYPHQQSSRTSSSPMISTRPTVYPGAQTQSSPTYDPSPRTAQPMSSQYAYSPFHPTYAYPIPSSAVPSHQPPPLQPPTWRSAGSDIDRAEEARKAASRSSPRYQAYGETVKRQLDIFDLETSLNEIAEGSGRTLNFTKQYSYKAYQHQRSGPTEQSLPSLTECDEMIRQQRGVLASMERIRDVIIKQRDDLAAERNRQEQGHKAAQDFDDEHAYNDKTEGGGGFAGADPKKRRGRAAPPGRCHSCNRAETPEWRRGPDGARTLCNACGLHYAKLTRKMGSKASTGSNLRPKESSPLSQ